MAKKSSETTKPMDNNSPNVIQKLFFWVIIPILFASAVLLIVAQLTNTNVFEQAKNWSSALPFVSNADENKVNGMSTKKVEEKLVDLQAQIQEKEAQVAQLQTKLDSSRAEKEQLILDQQKLLDEIENLKAQNSQSSKESKEIITTFESMSPKSAAPVIVKMSDAEAIRILTNLKPETLAKVLEKMDPEKAAKYTELLSK